MHDDIIGNVIYLTNKNYILFIQKDNAHTRRGLETAHKKYGDREAVFSGAYIIGRSG